MNVKNLWNRFANEWTGLGISFGLYMCFVYKYYTQDPVRTLAYGSTLVLLSILVFNFFATLFFDVYSMGLTKVFELIGFQTLAAIALVGLTAYAVDRLPFVPPGNWMTLEPAPEQLVALLDTPFENDQTWTMRARSVKENTFVYVCSFYESCVWQFENDFLNRDFGELSPNFASCQAQENPSLSHTPRKPDNIIDTHVVYRCGADVTLAIHLLLTSDGTVWHWTGSISALSIIGLMYMLGFGVFFVFLCSTGIGVLRFWQHRGRAR